jgi:hypothetical protein
VGNREYILTTTGQYSFATKINGEEIRNSTSTIVKRLNDKRIKYLCDNDLIGNWGWYGINLWVNAQCQDVPTDCYSIYDEAMSAFKEYVKKDLEKYLNQ